MDNPAFPSSGVSRVWMRRSSKLMQKADITTRAVAGFIDFLLILGLTRLPDVLGLLSASGWIFLASGVPSIPLSAWSGGGAWASPFS